MSTQAPKKPLSRLRQWIALAPLRVYLVVVLVAILPIALFSFYADRVLRQESEQQAAQSNLELANLSAILIQDHFRDSIKFLQAYATDPKFLQEWTNKDLPAIQREMERAPQLEPDLELVSTFSVDGTLTTASPLDPKALGTNFAYRDWYKGVVRNWTPYVSEVYRPHALPQQPSIAVAVPIKDASGKPIGIPAGAYSVQRISQWLIDVRGHGDRAISVIDQHGHLVASPTMSVSQPPPDVISYEPIVRAMRGERGANYFRRGDSHQFVAYERIPSLGWSVITEQPASAVQLQTSGVRHMSVLGILFMALAALGGMLLSVLTRRHQGMVRRIETMASSEASFRSLVQGATYGICRSDERGFVAVNPALVKMLGYDSEQELLALNLATDVYADPGERDRLIAAYRGEELCTGVEVLWKRRNGTLITVRISGRIIHDKPDNVAYFEGIIEDMTSRHVLEEQLRHSEKLAALGRLVAGAAHEINNPLTAIMGYAELLADDPTATAEQRSFADKIRQQTRRTRAITANLQSFSSQSHAEKQQLLEVNSILSNAIRIEDMNFGRNNISFAQSLDPNLPQVFGDEYQLLEVFMHVLNNSVDALKDIGGGAVSVRTRAENGSVMIEVSDNGAGMKDLARVFDPFYTTKPVGQGAGLGLSASYGIVKEHGGSITCSNRPEGGAVVTIQLPAANGTAKATAVTTSAASS